MPLVSTELGTQYYEPVAQGPVAQADYSTIPVASPQGTIPAGGDFTSAVINGDGYKFVTVAATSSQTLNVLSVQLYVDSAGTIPQGAATTTTMTNAAQSYIVNANGSTTPFRSFKINIHNPAGSPATITGYALILNAS